MLDKLYDLNPVSRPIWEGDTLERATRELEREESLIKESN